jgi:hypothetical protein
MNVVFFQSSSYVPDPVIPKPSGLAASSSLRVRIESWIEIFLIKKKQYGLSTFLTLYAALQITI